MVSDGSTDAMTNRLRELRHLGLVHVVHSTHLRAGKAAATNLAVKSATGDIIINVDCDCTLDRFAFENICQAFSDPRIGAVAGNIVVRNPKVSFVTGYQSLEYLVILSLGKRGSNIADTVVCASGAFSAFRKQALEAVKGLDAGGGEDLDLTLRIRKAGWGVQFAPEAICYTDVPETMGALLRQRFRWERDAIRLRFRKHKDQLAPMSSRLQGLELVHQLEYLIFDVGAALAMPFYLAWLFTTYGDTALPILIAAQLGMFVLDVFTLCLAALTMPKVLSVRHLLYMPAYSVMNSYFMRFVRLAAYFQEWIFTASYADSYVPAQGSPAALVRAERTFTAAASRRPSTTARRSVSILPPLRMRPTRRAAHFRSVLQQRGERGGACAFRHIMRVGVKRADGGGDLVFADCHDPRRSSGDDREGVRVGIAAGHPIRKGRGGISRHDAPGREGLRHRRRGLRDHADDFRPQPEQVARGDQPANARTHADRHIDCIEIGDGAEQLERIGRDTFDEIGMKGRQHMQAALGGNAGGVLPADVEIASGHDQLSAEAAHRCVLLGGIALGHDHDRSAPHPRRRERHRLAVIATRRGDHPFDVGCSRTSLSI